MNLERGKAAFPNLQISEVDLVPCELNGDDG